MWKSVRALCFVFISRVPRSSRVSRDLEKMLSRFSGFGLAAAAFGFGRNGCGVFEKTGVLLIINQVRVFILQPAD